jgi:hypothetical protein
MGNRLSDLCSVIFSGRKPKNTAPIAQNAIKIENTADGIAQNMTSKTLPLHPSLAYVPPPVSHSTQGDPRFFNFPQQPNHFYQYSQPMLCCFRCDQLVQYGFVAKCISCPKVCCFSCTSQHYQSNSVYFTCEQCTLTSCITSTQLLCDI